MSAGTINPPEAAFDVLVSKVRGPAILQKLASDWNIVPKTTAEVGQLLDIADEMHNAKEAGAVKSASADHSDPFLSRALSGLRQATGQPAIPAELFKQAADEAVSTDQDIANASLAYVDYLSALEMAAAAK